MDQTMVCCPSAMSRSQACPRIETRKWLSHQLDVCTKRGEKYFRVYFRLFNKLKISSSQDWQTKKGKIYKKKYFLLSFSL